MSHDHSYACITTDHGPASELVHVSPIFVSCGPRTRGDFADRRLTRTRRSDARLARRQPLQAVATRVADLSANTVATELLRYSDAVRGDTTDLQASRLRQPRS